MARLMGLLIVVGALNSCGGEQALPNSETTQSTTDPESTQDTSQAESETESESETEICASPNLEIGSLGLENAFPNLPILNNLIGLYQAPGDSAHWYALLRSGSIVRFDNNPAANSTELFLQIGNVTTVFEMGLLGLAFHPQYQTNGYVYVYYNDANNDGASTIARFSLNGGSVLDITTRYVILSVAQPANNHNGGDIHFGPDGYLYIGLGDGGGSNDEFNNGQNKNSMLAKLLRIDVDKPQLPERYGIPSSNPFINDSNFLPEIFAWGLRNPWRWSFDQQDGSLWLADVGQNEWEEVNIVNAGDNFGWPVMEGFHCFESESCDQSDLSFPIFEYDHSDGNCSVTGGYVYRGDSIPGLNGSYLFADYCTGNIWQAHNQESTWQMEQITNAGFSVAGFAQGIDGEVYVLNISGSAGTGIYQIIDTNPVSVSENESETEC